MAKANCEKSGRNSKITGNSIETPIKFYYGSLERKRKIWAQNFPTRPDNVLTIAFSTCIVEFRLFKSCPVGYRKSIWIITSISGPQMIFFCAQWHFSLLHRKRNFLAPTKQFKRRKIYRYKSEAKKKSIFQTFLLGALIDFNEQVEQKVKWERS